VLKTGQVTTGFPVHSEAGREVTLLSPWNGGITVTDGAGGVGVETTAGLLAGTWTWPTVKGKTYVVNFAG
jgi:hypothetical protein